MPKKKSVDSWLAERDLAIRPLYEAIQRIILRTAPYLEESIKWGNPTYTGNGNVFYISVANRYASLGFFNGASLTDPHRRIEGTAKKMATSRLGSSRT